MKIIAGKLKGHIIQTKKDLSYRPTTSRVKEAIFNILSSGEFLDFSGSILKNAVVLDIFGGTGALSFEAVSRGARIATIIDLEKRKIELLKSNIKKLGLIKQISILQASAINMPYADKQYNLIFLDPPFNKNFISPTIDSLLDKQWLQNQAVIVIETQKNEQYNLPEKFFQITERIYGCAKLKIFRYIA